MLNQQSRNNSSNQQPRNNPPNPNRPIHPHLHPNDPRQNPNHITNQGHPNPHHHSNRPHPNLHPDHPMNNPNHITNQPRFGNATPGTADPRTFESISVDVPETGMRDNPEVKVLQSGDKKVILSPDGIFLIAAGVTISLTDAEGITIISESDIHLQADENFLVKAAEEINVIGLEGITLKSDLANIEIDEDVHIEGKEVYAN